MAASRVMSYFIAAWLVGWVIFSVFWLRLSLLGYRRNYRSHTIQPQHRGGFVRSCILSVLVLLVWWPGPALFAAYDRASFWWRQR
jgi:hypothetical protein